MARKKAELEAELEELKETVRRLIAHTEVIAIAVLTPEAVPEADLESAVDGIHSLYSR
jgi:hypothetical protein